MNENRIVDTLRRRFGGRHSTLEKGIGDDAAVIKPRGAKEYWAITADLLVEEVDFRRTWQTPEQLGWKALAVNLSDLAGMGARPRFYTVSLSVPAGFRERWIYRLYRGITAAAEMSGAMLIGGDLSRSPDKLQISISALGESSRRRMVYRSGGFPGDSVYVTGTLGKAAAGLALLLDNRERGRNRAEREALNAFRSPIPRSDVGEWFARSGMVHAMMDLSDGLSSDLARLCRASGTGAEIYAERLPLFRESALWGSDPLSLALHGGEDFELLLAVPPAHAARLERNYPAKFPPLTRIGSLTQRAGVFWLDAAKKRRRLADAGFDHFRL